MSEATMTPEDIAASQAQTQEAASAAVTQESTAVKTQEAAAENPAQKTKEVSPAVAYMMEQTIDHFDQVLEQAKARQRERQQQKTDRQIDTQVQKQIQFLDELATQDYGQNLLELNPDQQQAIKRRLQLEMQRQAGKSRFSSESKPVAFDQKIDKSRMTQVVKAVEDV